MLVGLWSQAFNQDISEWDVSKVASMDHMFGDASGFNQDLCDWGSKIANTNPNVTGMFTDSGCTQTGNPSFAQTVISPLCRVCATTVTPTSAPTQTCFNTNQELSDAVDAYIADNSASSATAVTYGWPIGTWCVSYITDMFGLFRDKDTFNEDIGQWDVSSVSAMGEMFRDAKVCMIKIL